MATWNFERLERELRREPQVNLYCLYGQEVFLVEEALVQIIEASLQGASRDFNLDTFYCGDAEIASVRDAMEMLPMMAPRRVVILKSCENLKAKDQEELLPVIEKPIDSTVLIMVGEKIDQRKKLFKVFEQNGVLVKLDRLPEQQLPQWITKLVQQQGKQIQHDAINLLIQLVGGSLLDLQQELRKLCQYIGAKDMIESSHVREAVTHSRVESVFGLTHAIGERDQATALSYLAQLIDHGESEVGILALISRHVRILLMTKDIYAQGLTRAQISAKVGVPLYFVQNYIDQALRWSDAKLAETHERILEIDRALKSSSVSSQIWLESFILKTCCE